MEEDTASTSLLGSVLSLSLWGLRIVLPATAFWFYRQGGREEDETSEQHDHGSSSRSKDGLRENPEKNEEVAALSSMHTMSSEVTTSAVTGTTGPKTSSSTCSSTSTSCSVSPANNTSTSEQEGARHGGCGSDNEFREKKNLTKDQAAQEQLKALSKANLAGIEKLYKEMLTEEQEKEEGREIYSRKTFQMLAETCLEAAKWYDQQSVAEPAFWKTPKKMHRGESPSAVGGAYHSPSTRTVASSGYHSHQGTPLPSYQSTPLHGNKQQPPSSPEKNTINDLLALVGGQKGGNGKDENNYPPAIYSASEHGEAQCSHYWAAANPEYWHSTWSAAHASAAAAHHLTTSGAPDHLPHHHHLSPHYHPHHLAASTTLAPYWNAASHSRSYLDPANYWANVANHHGNWERTSTTDSQSTTEGKTSTGVEVAAVDQHTAAKTDTASTSSADQFQ
eukprot:g12091.t1